MNLLTSRGARAGGMICVALALASCAETQLGAQAVKEVVRTDAPEETPPELAPEAFDATGLTIWDGGATLEGVWVAHPLAQRAQRVRVTNTENGLAVEGAMFRRDPTLSGPSILVSSDAARSLGLQPGLPTELRIVALREGVYAETPATTTSSAAASDVETAALAAPSEPAPETAEAPATSAPEPVEVEPAVAAETPAAEPAQQSAEVTAPSRQSSNAITASDLAAASAADEPVQLTPEAAPAPEPEPQPTAAAAPEPAPTPEPAPAPQQASSSGPATAYRGDLPKGQFVQAGAFSVEVNAASLVDRLRAQGFPANYVNRGSGESPLSIVMIGPLSDEANVAQAIEAAAAAGAPGARAVTR